MNAKYYGKLIFELSHSGRRGYSLPDETVDGECQLPSSLCR